MVMAQVLAAALGDGAWADRVSVRGAADLAAAVPVADLAAASVAAASLAAQRLAVARARGREVGATDVTPVVIDADRLTTAYRSEQVFRLDGKAPDVWAAGSGYFQAADGWVRTHGNYPHHAAALERVLGLAAGADRVQVAAAIRQRQSQDLEDAAAAAGALIVRVRTSEQWAAHPQHAAIAMLSLLRFGEARPGASPLPASGGLPLDGVRVLDFTRVIAGPVATRTLARFGAEVLRIDSPRLPEIRWQYLDTGLGKRSAALDLDSAEGRARLEALLTEADVVVTGYRPGALTRFGLDAASLAERYPGLVVASVDAWGPSGPWASRRGFDSLVQAASGIAMLQARDGVPGALPAQALDHSAGYLLAAGIMRALAERQLHGTVRSVAVSLAGVAEVLLAARSQPTTVPTATSDAWRTAIETHPLPGGEVVTIAASPLLLAGAPAPSMHLAMADYRADTATWH